MIRLLTALALLLALSLPAAAQGCGPTNPNCVVPTRPVGTCDNTAASTQFVCNGGGGGGGGGAAITRAAIPATNTGGTPSLTLTGFATPGDRGSGAPYTCAGQTSASIGAIQDSAGTWCAFDIARVAAMNGWQDGWFGGKADGITDDTAAIQASYDASFNSGLGNTFCSVSAAARVTSYPLYYDPPGSMRGGAAWTPQFVFNSTGGYASGSIVASSNTSTNGILYANNSGTLAWSNPTSPDSTGYGMDLAYQIVSSTASVAYSPSWSPGLFDNAIVVASFKGSGVIGTPAVLGTANAQLAPNSFATTVSAPASSLIVVAIADSSGDGIASVTDNATGGSNVYTLAVHVDNITLGGVYIFYSTTGHPLPASNSAITVTGQGNNSGGGTVAIYQAIAVSVANASSGLDKTAFVDNTSNAINNPSVSTGALAQTNEIVFGALFSNSERISTNFVESPGFTFTTLSKWSLATWNAGTTYNAGDHVMYPPANPIPWQSLQSGNTNHIPLSDVGANFLPVWWQPITLSPSRNALSDGAYLHGSLMYTPGSSKHGCVISPSFNNSFALAYMPGNGMALTDFEIAGPNGATRCGQPTTGVGIVEFGQNAGSNRVKYENVSVFNFYYNFLFGTGSAQNPAIGGPGLGAENHMFTIGASNGCYGVYITGTQAFINSITDASITDNNTAVFTPATVGVKISGGNYSHEVGPFAASKFAMSGVSSAGITPNIGYSFTATLATPSDPYMTKTCADVISPTNLPVWPNVRCLTNVYNAFMLDLRSSGYGIVPFVMTAFNRNTGAATFYTLYSWFTAYGGQCCGSGLTTAIGAATNIWAAEMTRKFVGNNIDVDDIHIEDTAPFQLIDTSSQFAPGAPDTLKHIYFNSDYTNCNGYSPGNAPTEANCFAQQEFPFINIGQADLIIENVISTMVGNFGGEQNMIDFPPAAPGFTPHLTVRGWQFGQFNFRMQPFTQASNSFNQGNQGNFSGNYQGYGSAAFGQGDYEVAPQTGFSQAVSGPQQGGWTENAWLTRTQGLNRSPFYGTRPAPWSTPCISPLELVKATTFLPAIFVDGNNQWQVNYALLWSGQQYKICDWNLTPTAWNSGANYFPGSLVTNAGTIYVSLAGDANHLANNNVTPGTTQSFVGGISGTTLTVSSVTGRVLLHAPITSGAAAGTVIVQQLSGSAGSTGTYQVSVSQTVAGGTTFAATYWASLGATFHYGAVSNHFAGYSYGQDITTVNNSGLGWSITNNSPFMQITGGRTGLYFPGWVAGLAGTQAGCTTQENFVVRGVHGLLGYLDLFLLDSDVNGNVVPAFGAALCSNTIIKQAPYSVTNLN